MKKTTKRISIILLMTLLLISICKPVNAGAIYTVEMVSNVETVEKGAEFEVTIKVKDIEGILDGIAGLTAKLEYDTTKLEMVGDVEGLNNFAGFKEELLVIYHNKGEGVTQDTELAKLKFKAKEIGEATIKLSEVEAGDGTDIYKSGKEVTKTIKIQEKVTPPPTPEKSSNNNLASITIDGTPITNFNKDTLEYTLEDVENEKTSIEIKANAEDTKATVSGTGTKDLEVGTNTFEIKVTAEDGTTKTYKINVKREAEEGTADDDYNHAGVEDFFAITVAAIIVAVVLYKKNQKYKGI